jgi:tRNA(Ile2) C34 agmatinyltransferase TiaS
MKNNPWEFHPTDTTQSQCPKCGRHRISLCMNGKHLCEKCDYSPEEDRVIGDDELDGLITND